jgi:hypothetical protein
VHDLERRLRQVVGDAAGEPVRETGLFRLEDTHAETRSLVKERAHLRATVDRDEHERRPKRDRHESIRRHPIQLLVDARREHRDPRGEHPERPSERNGGVALQALTELECFGRGRDVERRSERLRGRDRSVHGNFELLWD